MHPSKFVLNVGFLVGASVGVLFPNLFQCKHENTQSIVIQDATCEKQGVVHVVCGKCDKTVSEDIIDALGHSFGEPIVLYEPGPNKNGVQKRICATCNEEEISPIIC